MYLYIGAVEVRGLRGYMWLLGDASTSMHRGCLGTLLPRPHRGPSDCVGEVMCLLPKLVDVRTVVAAMARALAMALYITRRYRGSPSDAISHSK